MYDSVPFFQRLGSLTEANKRRYADRHGYDFVVSTPQNTSGIYKKLDCYMDTKLIEIGPDASGECWGSDGSFDIDHSRAATFGKIKLALAACQGRGEAWLLWSDADAMVMNQSTALESIIDDAYDMMLTYDWAREERLTRADVCADATDWTKGFLNMVYNARKFDNERALDQSSFQEHIDNLTQSEREEHIKVVPKHAMNVYLEEYRPGDFLIHMAGKLYEATENGLYAIANQLDILSMVEDIEDVKAFFRNPAFLNFYSGVCPVKIGERQNSCKPGDDRRLFLNESLGSMSYPNRYRHVGLRYYWLGDWKDKYDVEGWNVKKKALRVRNGADHRSDSRPKSSANEVQSEVERLVHEQLGGRADGADTRRGDGATAADGRAKRAEAEGATHAAGSGAMRQRKRGAPDARAAVGIGVIVAVVGAGALRFYSTRKMSSKIQ
ncbi:hypothetical protein FGB62_22g517 [Gracilaria domingensis]|nr:hypothetical protein FGB62_22g517 [Gracilaria domingensis]